VRRPGSAQSALAVLHAAWRHLYRHRSEALLLGLAIGAICAPLLLLSSLQHGFVEELRHQLRSDPHLLELRLARNERLDAAWLERLGRHPQVGFLVPMTRRFEATIELLDRQDRRHRLRLLPSASADPLLPPGMAAPRNPGEILLGPATAAALGIATEGPIRGRLERHGRKAAIAILPLHGRVLQQPRGLPDDSVLVHPDLMVFAEDFRNGLRPPPRTADELRGATGQRTLFAGMRLYARDIDAVGHLMSLLEQQRYVVDSRAEEIARVLRIDRTLTLLIGVIVGVVAIGATLILTAATVAGTRRQARDIALLRLYGVRPGLLWLLPAVHSLSAVVAGLLFAGLLFLGSTMLLSAVTIAGAEIRVEPRIPPLAMLGWIVLGMFAAAAIGIAVAARQLGAVDPPAVLRAP
jgi:putative ABC transport system permease protein